MSERPLCRRQMDMLAECTGTFGAALWALFCAGTAWCIHYLIIKAPVDLDSAYHPAVWGTLRAVVSNLYSSRFGKFYDTLATDPIVRWVRASKYWLLFDLGEQPLVVSHGPR